MESIHYYKSAFKIVCERHRLERSINDDLESIQKDLSDCLVAYYNNEQTPEIIKKTEQLLFNRV